MTTVSRNNIYVRSERGGDWFNEFLESFAKNKPSGVQDVLNAIHNKRTETVESIVQSYREQVGLDSLSSTEDEAQPTVKKASTNFRPLSIRHAEEVMSVVQKIKNDPKIQQAIDSHCEHSGGTKNTHTLIHFLRDLLGKDVSFSDEELKEYLEERKGHYKDSVPEKGSEDVGRVGIDSKENHDDDMADYMRYDGAK